MLIEVKVTKEGKFLLCQTMTPKFFRMIVNKDGTSKRSINKVQGYISKEVKLLVEVKIGDYIFDRRKDTLANELVYDVSQIVDINTDIVPTAELKFVETISTKELTNYLASLRYSATSSI